MNKIPASLSAAKPIRLDLDASDAEIAKVAEEALKIYGRIDIVCAAISSQYTLPHLKIAR